MKTHTVALWLTESGAIELARGHPFASGISGVVVGTDMSRFGWQFIHNIELDESDLPSTGKCVKKATEALRERMKELDEKHFAARQYLEDQISNLAALENHA